MVHMIAEHPGGQEELFLSESNVRVEYRTCPLCEATCGLEVHVRGDQVEKIRGDRDHVLSRGEVGKVGVPVTPAATASSA